MAKASHFTLPYNIKQVCKYAEVIESRSYYLFCPDWTSYDWQYILSVRILDKYTCMYCGYMKAFWQSVCVIKEVFSIQTFLI
jgi:hypothetical protein